MDMMFLAALVSIALAFAISGCSTDSSGSGDHETLPPALPSNPDQTVTFPKTTGPPPTTRPPPTNACTGHKIGIYSWSQDYWSEGDPALTDFIQSDMGRTWNCGELYINVADPTNYNVIKYQPQLVAWMKKWRQDSGNDAIIWLTYGDVTERDGQKMCAFVNTYEQFLIRSVSVEDMAEIAPIGISFDVEHVPDDYYLKALTSSREMIANVTKGMGYLPNSIFVGSTIEGEPNQQETTYVMQNADRALMMLYRNSVNGTNNDGLLERMQWMLTDQCVVCTQPGWEDLKAKITIMVEGSCEMGNGCGKLSMCAYDTSKYPDPNGGIEYVWDSLQDLTNEMVPAGILTQDQYNKLFDVNGTLYAIHNWEWSRCYYGDSFSQQNNYTDCIQNYHLDASSCRTE
ncbi:hypothetical protein FOZ62_025642 [Perkinsus olseni]|uniref:Uncharacterized protein n=2 Tax=Perkinsus olseni TaxID=32597 RepID=A0A7J6QVQ8_PEROL|nr:hypothetical protein FOZ62_025642 [Perkinsus olseni]